MLTKAPLMLLCILFCFAGCQKESEQDKVKKLITNIQKATEEKDIKTVLNSLSKNYKDPQGNSYNDIKGMVIAYFYQHQKISMYIPSLEVIVEDASATAYFQAVFTGRGAQQSASGILPESLDMYAFKVSLKKEQGDWKVASATWERVAETQR